MLISVVMPSYNSGWMLYRAVQSVLEQTYTNWELIVVDNHSSDETKEILKLFNDTRIKIREIHNHGVIGRSRNCGIKIANGDWVAFLDSDDWWHKEKLWKFVNSDLDKTDLFHHDLAVFEEDTKKIRRTIGSWRTRTPVTEDLMKRGNAIATSSVIVRREILQIVEGFDERPIMIGIEDYHLWLKISLITNRFMYSSEVLGSYSERNNSVSKKNMGSGEAQILKEFDDYISDAAKATANNRLKFNNLKWAIKLNDFDQVVFLSKSLLREAELKTRIKTLILATIYLFKKLMNR